LKEITPYKSIKYTQAQRGETLASLLSQADTICALKKGSALMKTTRKQLGATLLEMLLVVVVILTLLAISVVGTRGVLLNFKANAAMDQVLGQMRSARERAITHRREVQVQFNGTNQIIFTEIQPVGKTTPDPAITFEGGAQFAVIKNVPDTPMKFGNGSAIYFEGQNGGPPIMKFTTTGAFVDGGNTLVNGTVFMGIPGEPLSARAVTVLGATGRVREYHYDGAAWQE
jgi:Tfp pilus assembly protein FimT